MPKPVNAYSANLEKLIEHLIIGEVLKDLWCRGYHKAEVITPEVDSAGWDVGFAIGGQLRFVQFKMKKIGGKNTRFKVHNALELKPGGCVVVIEYGETTFELGPFHWYGNDPSAPMPQLPDRTAKHTKGNKDGHKADRPEISVLNLGEFKKAPSISGLVDFLFPKTSTPPVAETPNRPKPPHKTPGPTSRPISLIPDNEETFKHALLKTRRATIKIHYQDGRTVSKTWHADHFKPSSSVMNNLRSRAEFRPKQWDSAGIMEAKVTVNNSGS